MNGSRSAAKPVLVADRALVEDLITLSLEASEKAEFRAGLSSRSRVLVEYLPSVASAKEDFELDFYLESGACVDVFHILKGDRPGASLSVQVRYHLKKHASLKAWTYVEGGDFSGLEQKVLFEEPHGFASINGLSILGGRSEVIHKVKAEHALGHCISRQFFKTIATGQARFAFESLVEVAKDAAKSDSKQLNKNLLLSKEARCQSRPELRIHTDDVSAAHGSATGELDKEELFYLRSRGLSRDQARLMMIEGFAAEMVDEISYAPLRERIGEIVQKQIALLRGGTQ